MFYTIQKLWSLSILYWSWETKLIKTIIFIFELNLCYSLFFLKKTTLFTFQGGTKDEAVVEVTCSIVFYLLESDYAFSITNKSPLDIVTTQTQLCLLSALTHLEWYYLEQGNAKIDLANETKVRFQTYYI